jgi:hypothetical protein
MSRSSNSRLSQSRWALKTRHSMFWLGTHTGFLKSSPAGGLHMQKPSPLHLLALGAGLIRNSSRLLVRFQQNPKADSAYGTQHVQWYCLLVLMR